MTNFDPYPIAPREEEKPKTLGMVYRDHSLIPYRSSKRSHLEFHSHLDSASGKTGGFRGFYLGVASTNPLDWGQALDPGPRARAKVEDPSVTSCPDRRTGVYDHETKFKKSHNPILVSGGLVEFGTKYISGRQVETLPPSKDCFLDRTWGFGWWEKQLLSAGLGLRRSQIGL